MYHMMAFCQAARASLVKLVEFEMEPREMMGLGPASHGVA
jgi:hypothetical protein